MSAWGISHERTSYSACPTGSHSLSGCLATRLAGATEDAFPACYWDT